MSLKLYLADKVERERAIIEQGGRKAPRIESTEQFFFDPAFDKKFSRLFTHGGVELAFLEAPRLWEDALHEDASLEAKPVGFASVSKRTAGDSPRWFQALLQRIARSLDARRAGLRNQAHSLVSLIGGARVFGDG